MTQYTEGECVNRVIPFGLQPNNRLVLGELFDGLRHDWLVPVKSESVSSTLKKCRYWMLSRTELAHFGQDFSRTTGDSGEFSKDGHVFLSEPHRLINQSSTRHEGCDDVSALCST